MAVNITDATVYISANCIDIEDWTESDDAKKQRIVNVASRTLTTQYSKYTIPDSAVYEFANVLAIIFNDQNRLSKHGVTSFSVSGVASFSFDASSITGPDVDLSKFIPQSALTIIGAENGVKLGKRQAKWTVL
ncbi:hypothetical protein NQ117_05280 [Paenibacillus sp. SC116]|uniref:hypothetical protein n=1 Tax=Paenibacillus sp. SC116 TaxID=2968986 RepID=UPI00215A3EDE|nr:hypothetical protein [Paenibacillus sp. SC116]MCR8843084.1 hypothetical protein [Paenibacillus sp. SC116]